MPLPTQRGHFFLYVTVRKSPQSSRKDTAKGKLDVAMVFFSSSVSVCLCVYVCTDGLCHTFAIATSSHFHSRHFCVIYEDVDWWYLGSFCSIYETLGERGGR